MNRRIAIRVAFALMAGMMMSSDASAQGRRSGAGRPPGARAGRPIPGPRGRTIIDRLSRMSPEERQRVLADLPPERKKRIEERLQEFNQLPPEERQKLRSRFEQFQRLPPERQQAARRLFGRFNSLPEDRRKLVQQEFRQLRVMNEADRRARLASDEFRSKYTPSEQQLVQDFSDQLLAPIK